MQNTRLNNLFNAIAQQLQRWFSNPWRRQSLLLISLLFGFFLGSAIPTTTGQAAIWDITAAGLIVIFTEVVSRIVYRRPQQTRTSIWVEVANSLKIGLTYGLFLEAFKIGS